MKLRYTDRGANISKCKKYRYHLWRQWKIPFSREIRTVLFIMLNPSTADGSIDDATIRRCIAYARAWGYNRIEVVNLFAFRATDPKELKTAVDPIGPRNRAAITIAAANAELIICAWGAMGSYRMQDKHVRAWLADYPLFILGMTNGEAPRHPLYLRKDAKPIPLESYRGRDD